MGFKKITVAKRATFLKKCYVEARLSDVCVKYEMELHKMYSFLIESYKKHLKKYDDFSSFFCLKCEKDGKQYILFFFVVDLGLDRISLEQTAYVVDLIDIIESLFGVVEKRYKKDFCVDKASGGESRKILGLISLLVAMS